MARRIPLSFGQEQLWFLEQLRPGTPTYNIAVLYRLRGQLDRGWLNRALTRVVDRHDVLRASFGAQDGTPFQTIAAPGPVTLAFDDLTGLPVDERDPAALREAALEAAEPFDLRIGPLFRFRLIRIDAEHHLLSIVIHHIVSDGWSFGLFNAELSQAYEQLSRGEEFGTAASTSQYEDFVSAQRAAVRDNRYESQLTYWENQLRGLPVLDLTADRPRPALAGHQGSECLVEFPGELREGLHTLARAHGVSPFMVLVSVFGLVLSRYTGAEDIPIGTTMLGRVEPMFERLIGMFVNMVVLRLDLSKDPTFGELLDRVREVTLASYDNQGVPFEKVVNRLNLPRDPSRNPLFQVCVQTLDDNTGGDTLALPGITATPVEQRTDRSRFDLSVTFTDSSRGLSASMEYSTELFDAWRMEQLGRHLSRVLAAVVDDPSVRLSEVQLVTADERAELLTAGIGPHDELRAAPVHVIVAEQAAATPDAVAVMFEGGELTYGDLDRRAEVVARHLRAVGVQHEEIVGVAIDRGLDVLVAVLGVLKAGACFVMLDTDHPMNRLQTILDDGDVTVVLTRSDLVPSLPEPGRRRYIRVDLDWSVVEEVTITGELSEWATPDSLVYALYTSGSTGKPKGVPIEHRALISYLTSFVEMFGLGPGDRMLQFASLSFDLSQAEIFSALITGATLVFARRDTLLSPEALATLIRRERVTYIGAPPAMLALLEPEPYPDLRNVLVGGEACPPDLVNRWNLEGRKFVNGYGPTEATIGCTMYAAPRITWRSSPPIGRPLQHRRLYVVDRWGALAPKGIPGELLIGGDEGLARGYINRPELTGERFVKDPFWPEGRVYHSGDLVRWTSDWQVDFLGRVDNQVKLRGLRIELEEIETVLATHPGVEHAAVALREDAAGQKALCGYFVASAAGAPSLTELRSYLGEHLPSYMVPSAWTVLDALPLSTAGKINRAALPAPTSFVDAEREVIAPETVAERHVAAAFAEVLDVPTDRISVNDDFFELGGNSLQAMRVISRINRAFALDLGVRALYGAPRLRDIAERIADTATVAPADPDDPGLTGTPMTTVEQISAIFAEVLGDSVATGSVSNNSNLFDLGGDESSARAVLGLIADRTGIVLTEHSFYRVATLANAVEAERTALQARDAAATAAKALLVPLNTVAGDEPALFCVPGASGSAYQYVGLARELGRDRQIIGLEAPSPEQHWTPLDTVPALAAAFVAAIRTRQPHGPYHLLGWSTGGLVAYEIACQLEARGERVAYLAALDTQLPTGSDVPTTQELLERFVNDLADAARQPAPDLATVLAEPNAQRRSDLLFDLLSGTVLPTEIERHRLRHQLAVFLASGLAAHTYRPTNGFTGRLTVIRTADALTVAEDWAAVTGGDVAELIVPGGHHSMWEPKHLGDLASTVRDSITVEARPEG
ncbi:amino acid adenylation domain-containing protein [Kutzneria sp. NPDC052558]|uniref:amino acid adenylation domain-containing protein n=1 Tax=Kutzneria sp. NPDC052558 TaxID=3364121 RepID=UPI0037C5202C